jgi:aminoglycoside phosphotransferase family enzyme
VIATADQGEVIAFLSRGDVYGQPGATVERIETHASVVFLVGDRVYKLKRALRYSYLDYSTVEKREAMCRAELLLNRRTAPQLYLGIRAVARESDGALALDGAGEPVDWLVEMARFPQDMLFDRLAEKHKLTPLVMRDLADAIAAFHDGAERCDVTGYSAAMRDIADGNIRNLRFSGATLDPDKIATLAWATAAALARVEPLLDKRGRDGHVRRCHGDLHLRNICLIEGKPGLFDGIEFNEEFIRIDKLYDLAFLLMDLDHRGLDDGASTLFNRYLDWVGDDTGLAVLPLYLSIRAAVRAHVSMAAVGQSRTEQSKPTLVAEASQYLDLALALLAPARPCLVAVGGFSGSGKSTVAHALAPSFRPFPGARILRSDVLRKRLAGVLPETRLPETAYDLAANERVYRALYEEAAEALKRATRPSPMPRSSMRRSATRSRRSLPKRACNFSVSGSRVPLRGCVIALTSGPATPPTRIGRFWRSNSRGMSARSIGASSMQVVRSRASPPPR